MVRLVLEISEKEKKALQKSSKEIKDVFRRIKSAFQVRVVKKKK